MTPNEEEALIRRVLFERQPPRAKLELANEAVMHALFTKYRWKYAFEMLDLAKGTSQIELMELCLKPCESYLSQEDRKQLITKLMHMAHSQGYAYITSLLFWLINNKLSNLLLAMCVEFPHEGITELRLRHNVLNLYFIRNQNRHEGLATLLNLTIAEQRPCPVVHQMISIMREPSEYITDNLALLKCSDVNFIGFQRFVYQRPCHVLDERFRFDRWVLWYQNQYVKFLILAQNYKFQALPVELKKMIGNVILK